MTKDTPSAERLTWAQTRALIRSDQDRLAHHLQKPDSWVHRIYFQMLPGAMALLLHRLSRHAYLAGWFGCARIVQLIGMYLTRCEIPPTSSLGPGAMIYHATGVNLYGRAGARFTVTGNAAIGGGLESGDIGGGPGCPVLGDDVTLAYGACVLGPVRVGDGVRVGPGALVTFDVSAGSLVLWDRPRVVRGMTRAREAEA